MGEPTFFCPHCYAEVPRKAAICPQCGYDIDKWANEATYVEQLCAALRHPVSNARMGSIITLGNLALPEAARPLAQCAFDYPADAWQATEIMRSLDKIADGPQKQAALERLATHPSRVIRSQALERLP